MTEPCDLSAVEARRLIGLKQLSAVELLESCLARIDQVNPAVNAMTAMDPEAAMTCARAADETTMQGGELPALHGLPMAVKDMDESAGLRTSFGSPIFADYVSPKDDHMVATLRAKGAVILGKTNVPEFGLGANSRNLVWGATGNAFNPAYNAAGSSGGSAVALATSMVPLATGSDMGGSLRNPAAFNGVVGFRPSPGIVPASRRGHGWSPLVVLGPMARNVADAALMFSAMASDDAVDPLSYTVHGRTMREDAGYYHPVAPIDLSTMRLAFTQDFGRAPTESIVRRAFEKVSAALAPMFAEAKEAHPDVSGGDEAFEVLRAASMLAAHLERTRKTPELCGPNLHANVQEGLRYSLVDHANALTRQTQIYRNFQSFFEKFDVLVSPAITTSPRPWQELYPAEIDGKPTRSYFHWPSLAYYVTLTGHPAISLPVGVDEKGFPFGLQIVGPRGGDVVVLRVAAAIEAAFAGDAAFARPVPDIEALTKAVPISAAPDFRRWG